MSDHHGRCDYQAVAREYPWIRERHRRFIVSGDLDGMMSAVLLSHHPDWRLAGFYTLNDLYVAADSGDIVEQVREDPERMLRRSRYVFVDHDIYRNDIPSVGHHLLQWSSRTPIPLHAGGNASLNPNLLRGVTKQKFFNRKYPFGTFHFLLACFSAWGLLEEFAPDDDLTTLLLHIDSSFENAIKYQDNALSWLDWLGGSDQGSPLYPICRRMIRFNPRKIIEQFGALAQRFAQWGLRPRRQAAFTNPTDARQWQAQRRLLEWVHLKTRWRLASECGADIRYEHFRVRRYSAKPLKRAFIETVERAVFLCDYRER